MFVDIRIVVERPPDVKKFRDVPVLSKQRFKAQRYVSKFATRDASRMWRAFSESYELPAPVSGAGSGCGPR
jgi:hypothetical protein